LRTSECGDAASKRLQSRSPLDRLATDDPWVVFVDAFRTRNPRRRDRIAEYERFLDAGTRRRIGSEVLAGRYRPDPHRRRG
jgi:hypothetical protein